MIPFLWIDLVALAVGTVVAALDLEVEHAGRKLGRPLYGLLVVAGLVGVYVWVIREGAVPLPGWGIVLFALLYLPFLSSSFIDLETTDHLAQRELEHLLLETDFRALARAEGRRVLREGRRRHRMHWESRPEDDGVIVELDVHPSLLPITISRPHVVFVRDQLHLERVRADILRFRGGEAHG